MSAMGTLVLSPASARKNSFHELPQNPLDRLRPLRLNVAVRRSTFSSWPNDANVSPGELSKNGFYYTGIKDKVQCAFCGGVLSGWSKDDNIAREHARHFSKCEFVCSKKKSCVRRCEFSVPEKDPGQHEHSLDPAIKPFNIQYALYSDRLQSFKSWPKDVGYLVPADLAATGLYHKGDGDKCQCYMCGGVLSEWENGNVPKEEHKKWFPKCPLMK